MKTALSVAVMAATLGTPAFAAAQEPTDRVTFGGDAVVREGEVVKDVVTMGGDARSEPAEA